MNHTWTCLLGTSGVGKSTLLRLLGGLPTNGRFHGDIVYDNPQKNHQRVAFMSQSDLLYPWLTVYQNVMLGQQLRGKPSSNQEQRAKQLIQDVGLADAMHKRPLELSGGMKQRTALARTLMEDTSIVLLDEPFSALDSQTRYAMQELAFTTLREKTVLLVTHDPLEALRLADHLYVLNNMGLHKQYVPTTTPLRDIGSPQVREAQIALLNTLANTDKTDVC